MAASFRRILRYAGFGAVGIVLLLVMAVAFVGMAGGRRLSVTHEVRPHTFVTPEDSMAAAEGERLAAYWGCTGCHERDGSGGVFFETPLGDRLVAPNLTRIVHEYSPAELERAIRHGVRRKDGRSVVVMPSAMYAGISDEDLGKVIGYLRSLPQVRDTLPDRRLGLMARYFVLIEDGVLQAANVDPAAAHPPSPDSLTPASPREDTLALGRYLAHTGCPECHGPDLRGSSDGGPPDLRIAAAYTPESFRKFFQDGMGLGGRDLGLMTAVAKFRGGRLTDDEARALHAYLSTLADRPDPAG
jgi:mono/diheme cytochrome c family protein